VALWRPTIWGLRKHWVYCKFYVKDRGPGERSRYSDSIRAGRSGDGIPVGGEISRTRPDRSWGPLSPLYNEYLAIPRDKAAGAWR
jgi:hypothetical protein